jgi:prolyl oligopeptidase
MADICLSRKAKAPKTGTGFLLDLRAKAGKMEPFLETFDASYTVVGNDGDTFYILTNRNAPRYRLVAVSRDKPKPESWNTDSRTARNLCAGKRDDGE